MAERAGNGQKECREHPLDLKPGCLLCDCSHSGQERAVATSRWPESEG